MSRGLPFDFEIPIAFFEKAGAEPGHERRIGGLVSTETPDQEGEIVLQRGLDFGYFLKNGWFNDNHSKKTTDIVGYPEAIQIFEKGSNLPSGDRAPARGTWVEGYLLDSPKADELWETGRALQKTKRRLGYSVEGKVKRRAGPGGMTVAKATVRNVAITNCPINDQSKLEILAKSLQAVEEAEPEAWEKALTMGTPTPGVAPVGPLTGAGAGQVLVGESLETDDDPRFDEKKKKKKETDDAKATVKKGLTTTEAIAWVRARLPNASHAIAQRIVETTRRLKAAGRL